MTGDNNGDEGVVYKVTLANIITIEDLSIDFRYAEDGELIEINLLDS